MTTTDLEQLALAATPGPYFATQYQSQFHAALSPERVLAMIAVIDAAKAMRVDIASHENLTLVGSPARGGFVTPTHWYSAALFDERLAALDEEQT